jgi:hypothetical protein
MLETEYALISNCCRTEEYPIVEGLYPGDSMWSYFNLNTDTNLWSVPWELDPGPAGQAAGGMKATGEVDVTLRE